MEMTVTFDIPQDEFQKAIQETMEKMPDYKLVVRCKDCKYSYYEPGGYICSHGVCVDCIVPEDFWCREGVLDNG